MRNNIILIGYMGCGKSSVGMRLSQALNRTFLDTDQWIEEKEQTTISEIFASQGEESFRDMETACLQELINKEEERVISVGGGLPLREENRQLLHQLGHVVYLKAEPETVYERLKGDTTRPLLQTENPQTRIREMMAIREEKYQAAADMVIQADSKSFEEIIEEIMEAVKDNKQL